MFFLISHKIYKKKFLSNFGISQFIFIDWLNVSPNLFDKKFQCDICKKSYRYKRALVAHQRYECENKNQFKCSHCPQKCSLFHSLQRHLLGKHGITEYMNKKFYMISK